MSISSSSSTSIPPSASAGPSGQNTHPSVENNDEKNRYVLISPSDAWHVKNFTIDHPSVVIKVGMVGDSQIGKTSLMVKYVEGSFDEDYIQTLGMSSSVLLVLPPDHIPIPRRQFHGEDNLCPSNNHHVFHLGLGWAARVCEYVASCLQRCRCYSVHV